MAASERLIKRLCQFGDDEWQLLYQLADEVRAELGWASLGAVGITVNALRHPLPEVVSVVVGRICSNGESPAYDELADQLEAWDPAGFRQQENSIGSADLHGKADSKSPSAGLYPMLRRR